MSNLLVTAEGATTTVVIHRPDKLNALNNETIEELIQCFTDIEADDSVGAVILTGAGDKAFVAGADISGLAKQDVSQGRQNAQLGQRLSALIEASTKPVLAAINGYALGGGLELALACDVRYASAKARLGLPEVSLGIIPGYGGTQRLPRVVGQGRALEMILTGDPVTADRAYEMGLVNAVCEPDELMTKTQECAARMISRGPTALGMAKEAVYRGAAMGLADGLALEADLFGVISSTDEMREGMVAFLERRDPSWKRG